MASQLRPQREVSVFVATDRTYGADAVYSNVPKNESRTHYLKYVVSVPYGLKRGGNLLDPNHGDDRDLSKQVCILREKGKNFEKDKDRFFEVINQAITGISRKNAESQIVEVLMLVPGYNTKLDPYVRLAAKLAFDLNFYGIVILYSWASGDSKLSYPEVHKRMKRSMDKVINGKCSPSTDFLQQFREKVTHPNVKFHILAHSMGCRVATMHLLAFIQYLGVSSSEQNQEQNMANAQRNQWGLELISQIVFTAADQSIPSLGKLLEVLRLSSIRHLARELRIPTVTFYTSREDKALDGSYFVHNVFQANCKYYRGGDTDGFRLGIEQGVLNPRVKHNFVDVVDVTGLKHSSRLRHSYYYSEVEVLDDMMAVFGGARAATRSGLGIGMVHTGGVIYAFHPDQMRGSKLRFRVTKSISDRLRRCLGTKYQQVWNGSDEFLEGLDEELRPGAESIN